MTVTQAKLDANRQNAENSTGPRSEEGKARSALNAGRHFLTGQTIVMPGDNLALYASFSADFRDEWKPVGPTEKHLVQTLSDTQWRMHRASSFEFALYANGHDRLGNKINTERPEVHETLTAGLLEIDQSKELDRFSRHSSRLKREYHSVLQELQNLQAQRQARELTELHNAALLRKFHEMQQTTFTPALYGFVLQPARIDSYVRLTHDLEQAGIARDAGFNLEKYRTAVQS